MCLLKSYTKNQKRILGRWLEALGIGVVSGGVVTCPVYGLQYWYFLIGGVFITLIGTKLYENNSNKK